MTLAHSLARLEKSRGQEEVIGASKTLGGTALRKRGSSCPLIALTGEKRAIPTAWENIDG